MKFVQFFSLSKIASPYYPWLGPSPTPPPLPLRDHVENRWATHPHHLPIGELFSKPNLPIVILSSAKLELHGKVQFFPAVSASELI